MKISVRIYCLQCMGFEISLVCSVSGGIISEVASSQPHYQHSIVNGGIIWVSSQCHHKQQHDSGIIINGFLIRTFLYSMLVVSSTCCCIPLLILCLLIFTHYFHCAATPSGMELYAVEHYFGIFEWFWGSYVNKQSMFLWSYLQKYMSGVILQKLFQSFEKIIFNIM